MRYAWIHEPPFNHRVGGALTGCDVALAQWVAAAIGERFEPVETTFAELLDGLADRRWDMTPGMFITEERTRRAAFTRPIWALRDGLLVRDAHRDLIDGYRSVARAGMRLAVLRDQVQMRTALDLGVRPQNIVVLEDYADAAALVAAGAADAYASVAVAHRAHVAGQAGLACVTVPAAEKPADLGAFACSSTDLRDRVDTALTGFLGTEAHARLLARFGLSGADMAP